MVMFGVDAENPLGPVQAYVNGAVPPVTVELRFIEPPRQAVRQVGFVVTEKFWQATSSREMRDTINQTTLLIFPVCMLCSIS